MNNIFVIAHHTRPEVPELLGALQRWAKTSNHMVWMPHSDALAHGLQDVGSDRHAMDADLVVSLGGDGTVLRAVHLLDGAPVPILGVNVGTLGYLTELDPTDFIRSMQIWSDGVIGTVLEKQQSGHTIWLDLVINNQDFARYSADGLIVSTPTGSTAYSMSARGPVVSPRHRALLITPVSPHMLFDRALVLDPQESVHIKVVGTRPVDMAIDGRRVTSLSADDVVVYAPDTCSAHFLRFSPPKFHQIVRAKFGLGDD